MEKLLSSAGEALKDAVNRVPQEHALKTVKVFGILGIAYLGFRAIAKL